MLLRPRPLLPFLAALLLRSFAPSFPRSLAPLRPSLPASSPALPATSLRNSPSVCTSSSSPLPCDDAQPLLDGRGKLHASQAVEVQIFGQPQLVAHAGVGFAGDLRDEREQPVGGGPEVAFSACAGAPLLVVAAAAWIRASHAATGLRLTLPVEVRGRSGSGHSTQRLMR